MHVGRDIPARDNDSRNKINEEIGENAEGQSRRCFKADGSLSESLSRIETRSCEICQISPASKRRMSRRDLRETTKLLPVCFGIIFRRGEGDEDASARFVSAPAGKSAVQFERALSG
jgi:hypothetical protein